MKASDLINERQILCQSNHTLIDIPFNIHNDRMNALATYYDYRNMGAKNGKPLNPLEQLACDILKRHAHSIKFERILNGVFKEKYGRKKINNE